MYVLTILACVSTVCESETVCDCDIRVNRGSVMILGIEIEWCTSTNIIYSIAGNFRGAKHHATLN